MSDDLRCLICGEPARELAMPDEIRARLAECGCGICSQHHLRSARDLIATGRLMTQADIRRRAKVVKAEYLASTRDQSQPHLKEQAVTDAPPSAPNLIRLLSNAGAEELEAIRNKIKDLQGEIESLQVFEKALAKRVEDKPKGKLSDRIIAWIKENHPAAPSEIADALGVQRRAVIICGQKTRALTIRKDGTIALAK